MSTAMASLANIGLKAFNAEYARRRRAGETRLAYAPAKRRFKRELVRRLQRGGTSAGLMEAVLNDLAR